MKSATAGASNLQQQAAHVDLQSANFKSQVHYLSHTAATLIQTCMEKKVLSPEQPVCLLWLCLQNLCRLSQCMSAAMETLVQSSYVAVTMLQMLLPDCLWTVSYCCVFKPASLCWQVSSQQAKASQATATQARLLQSPRATAARQASNTAARQASNTAAPQVQKQTSKRQQSRLSVCLDKFCHARSMFLVRPNETYEDSMSVRKPC